ncbi:MAG: hypothetical protein LUQ37_06050 [Methanoregulaceae archaeon]|nr:hypothetical protein [Methanoregulaceae archaeon]
MPPGAQRMPCLGFRVGGKPRFLAFRPPGAACDTPRLHKKDIPPLQHLRRDGSHGDEEAYTKHPGLPAPYREIGV